MIDAVQIGDATLYCGDCREILPSLEDNSIDCTMSDPPYEEEAHTQQRRLLGRQQSKVRAVVDEPLVFPPMSEEERELVGMGFARVTAGWILVFCQAEAVALWRDSVNAGGAKYRRSCIWIKPDGQPQLSGDRPGQGYESIVTAWSGGGRSVWNGGGKHGIYNHAQRDNNSPKLQQAQKPIKLMNDLVADFTQPGDIVADFYMGSGTTGEACLSQGRKFIGVEKHPGRFEAACARIEMSQAQMRLLS